MTKQQNNSKLILTAIVVILLLIAGWYYFSNSSGGSFTMAGNPAFGGPKPVESWFCIAKNAATCTQVKNEKDCGNAFNCVWKNSKCSQDKNIPYSLKNPKASVCDQANNIFGGEVCKRNSAYCIANPSVLNFGSVITDCQRKAGEACLQDEKCSLYEVTTPPACDFDRVALSELEKKYPEMSEKMDNASCKANDETSCEAISYKDIKYCKWTSKSYTKCDASADYMCSKLSKYGANVCGVQGEQYCKWQIIGVGGTSGCVPDQKIGKKLTQLPPQVCDESTVGKGEPVCAGGLICTQSPADVFPSTYSCLPQNPPPATDPPKIIVPYEEGTTNSFQAGYQAVMDAAAKMAKELSK